MSDIKITIVDRNDCRGIAPIEGTESILCVSTAAPDVIAEALPRLRGLKVCNLFFNESCYIYCRGIAPIEGTERPPTSREANCFYYIAEALPRLRGLKVKPCRPYGAKRNMVLQRHCPD